MQRGPENYYPQTCLSSTLMFSHQLCFLQTKSIRAMMAPAFHSTVPICRNCPIHYNSSRCSPIIKHDSDSIVKYQINCLTFRSSSNSKFSRLTSVQALDVYGAVSEAITAASDQPNETQVTWEILVGAIAGVLPFVVAGIEFSKRIIAQKRCKTCAGSGLVLRDNKYYFRCPKCGGFLPWQSWKRFLSG